MPPLTRNNGQRELEVMIANPARMAHAVATSQQSGLSGQIPGTESDPTQLAALAGTIQSYPNGPSPNGDQVAGVGHQVLNNAGNPVVFMGNLSATQTSGTDLPSDFQDGGFAFVDADGNLPAGYSQSTGLWGFGSNENPVGTFRSNWQMCMDAGNGYGWAQSITIPQSPSYEYGVMAGGCAITQVGYYPPPPFEYIPELQYKGAVDEAFLAVVSAGGSDLAVFGLLSLTALDGSGDYLNLYATDALPTVADEEQNVTGWTEVNSSGSAFSIDGGDDSYIIIAEPVLMVANFQLSIGGAQD